MVSLELRLVATTVNLSTLQVFHSQPKTPYPSLEVPLPDYAIVTELRTGNNRASIYPGMPRRLHSPSLSPFLFIPLDLLRRVSRKL
jgi:hypothetical protein